MSDMTPWKYTDASCASVFRTTADGMYESWDASTLPEGTEVLPADPVPLAPLQCTKRQGERALLTLPAMVGEQQLTALHWVEAHIEQEPDPIQKRAMQAEFNSATWEEANPFLQQMWQALQQIILGEEKPQSLRAVFLVALTF